MSRKVFTAGEVLAAADVNSFLMDQTVMSFAGTAARGSAIPSPVEGMYTHLEDVDRLEFYNGSAFVPSNSLQLIKTQTIGSGVSSVIVSDVFSSTYDNYKVIVSGLTCSVNVTGLRSGLNNSLGSTFFWAGNAQIYDATNFFLGQNNTSSWQVGTTSNINTNNCIVEFFNPFSTASTTFKSQFATRTEAGQFGGVDSNAVSQTGFTLFALSGTMTGGTINVYGYRKS
jgi:hypothetical protein